MSSARLEIDRERVVGAGRVESFKVSIRITSCARRYCLIAASKFSRKKKYICRERCFLVFQNNKGFGSRYLKVRANNTSVIQSWGFLVRSCPTILWTSWPSPVGAKVGTPSMVPPDSSSLLQMRRGCIGYGILLQRHRWHVFLPGR